MSAAAPAVPRTARSLVGMGSPVGPERLGQFAVSRASSEVVPIVGVVVPEAVLVAHFVGLGREVLQGPADADALAERHRDVQAIDVAAFVVRIDADTACGLRLDAAVALLELMVERQ